MIVLQIKCLMLLYTKQCLTDFTFWPEISQAYLRFFTYLNGEAVIIYLIQIPMTLTAHILFPAIFQFNRMYKWEVFV